MNTKIAIFLLNLIFFLTINLNAQPKENEDSIRLIYPIAEYEELVDPNPPTEDEWKDVAPVNISWGTSNTRYSKTKVPILRPQKKIRLQAWKGERISAQAVVWSKNGIENLNFELKEPVNSKGEKLSKDRFTTAFVRYVMTDELNKEGEGSCGDRPDRTLFDSLLVADPIDHHLKEIDMRPNNTQGIWVKCTVPAHALTGVYKGSLILYGDNRQLESLNLEIEVLDRTLPAPSDWKMHIDLWQNPFAIARYYGTPLWSDSHFEAMKPYMKMLAGAGQKVITTSIIHKPWNGQTQDYFETMLTVIKKIDGTWTYDYAIFDKWVEFMMKCGIDKQINCYTMIPWVLSFKYYDQATNSMKNIEGAPGDKNYEEFWTPLLKDFTKHLKSKGWFNLTTIAMDERPMEVMQKTIKLIRDVDSNLKISLAGNYHEEIESNIYDYSISLSQIFPKKVLDRRKNAGQISTYYTSCSHSRPNYYTFSVPSEAIWLNFLMAKDQIDGYLRWAYNSWVPQPLTDSRFRSWAGGDTYFVYPGNRSSIRFEKLIEGTQLFEKILLLRDEFEKKRDKKSLDKLNKIMEPFILKNLTDRNVTEVVEKALKEINKL